MKVLLIQVPTCLEFISVYYHVTTREKKDKKSKKKKKKSHLFLMVKAAVTDCFHYFSNNSQTWYKACWSLSMLLLTSRGLYAHSSEQLCGGNLMQRTFLLPQWSGSSHDEEPPLPNSMKPKLL